MGVWGVELPASCTMHSRSQPPPPPPPPPPSSPMVVPASVCCSYYKILHSVANFLVSPFLLAPTPLGIPSLAPSSPPVDFLPPLLLGSCPPPPPPHIIRQIILASVVLKRTAGDSDWHFNNLSSSHLKSQSDIVSSVIILYRHPLTIQYYFDSEGDYRSGCRNVSHCHQQFFSELHSPERSH